MIWALVLGVREGELKPPHHYPVSPLVLGRIHARMRERPHIPYGCAADAIPTLEKVRFFGEEEVEVYGAWSDWCLRRIIVTGMQLGLDMKLPHGLALGRNGDADLHVDRHVAELAHRGGFGI